VRRHSFAQSILRLIKYRLIVPLLRSVESPEHTARGVLVGVAWAFTPLIGVQMPLIALTWALARWLIGWRFHLLVALAWAWVTNAVTLVPTYYGFYLTGQLLLGRWSDLSGYDAFGRLLDRFVLGEGPPLDRAAQAITLIAQDWGLALVLGCLPWMAVLSWLGYRWTFRLMTVRRQRQTDKI